VNDKGYQANGQYRKGTEAYKRNMSRNRSRNLEKKKKKKASRKIKIGICVLTKRASNMRTQTWTQLVLHRNIIDHLFLLHILERIKQRGDNIRRVGNSIHGVRFTSFRDCRLIITFHSQLLSINQPISIPFISGTRCKSRSKKVGEGTELHTSKLACLSTGVAVMLCITST
jgi:hypothetical protein